MSHRTIMGRSRTEALTVTQEIFDEYALPYFNHLGYEAHYRPGTEPGTVLINHVLKAAGAKRHIPDEEIVKILDAFRDRFPTGEALPDSELFGAIAGSTFLRFVLPFFNTQGWTLKYDTDPGSGAVMVSEVRMMNSLPCGLEASRAMLALSLPRDGVFLPSSEEIMETVRSLPRPTLVEDHKMRIAPPPAHVFDYTKLREDPGNAAALDEYAATMIMVHRDYMIKIVRPAFREDGLIYSGTHFGDGRVAIEVVINAQDVVMPPENLKEILKRLGVPFSEEEIARRPEVTVEADVFEEPVPEEQITGAPYPSGQPGSLILFPEDKFGISAKYSEETGSVDVKLEIGNNVVWVHCSLKQATEFLIDGSLILLTELSVTSTDEDGLETKNVITQEEITEEQMEAKQNDEETTTNNEEEIEDE